MMLELEDTTNSKLFKFLESRGLMRENIVQITALPILHHQWELDHTIWLVNINDGTVLVLGTNHGRLCLVSQEDLQAKYQEYTDLASSYSQILMTPFAYIDKTKI